MTFTGGILYIWDNVKDFIFTAFHNIRNGSAVIGEMLGGPNDGHRLIFVDPRYKKDEFEQYLYAPLSGFSSEAEKALKQISKTGVKFPH